MRRFRRHVPTLGPVFTPVFTPVSVLMSVLLFALVVLPATSAVCEPPRLGLFEMQVDGIGACRAVALGPDGAVEVIDEGGRLVSTDSDAPTSLRDLAIAIDGSMTVIGDGGISTRRLDGDWRTIAAEPGVAIDRVGDLAFAVLDDGSVLAIDIAAEPPAIRWRRDAAYPGARGIAGRPDGGVWIADTDRHRLVLLGPDGEERRARGDRGAFPGLFNTPVDLDIAGDRLFVADMLNHRVSVHAAEDGAFLDQWGMHAVVPREGDGRIHYPEGVAVSADGTRVVVLEPFERRYQVFGPVPADEAPSGSTLPGKRGVESHFGTDIAADGGVLAMWEPESGTAVAFDLRYDIPIHVAAFGHGGTAPVGFGRLVAAGVDGSRNEIWLVDAGHRRIARWMLRSERPDELIYDPFMGRFARGWSFEQVAARIAQATKADTPRVDPVDVVVRGDRVHLLDAEMPGIVVADRTLAIERVVSLPEDCRPTQLACRDDGGWLVLDADDATLLGMTVDGEVDRRVDLSAIGIAHPFGIVEVGELVVVSDRATDRLFSLDRAGEVVAIAGETGAWDGALWRPAALTALPWKDGGTIVAVVDQGNHRAQGFDPVTGEWRVTFSLGQGHDQIRLRREDFEPPAGPPSTAAPEAVK